MKRRRSRHARTAKSPTLACLGGAMVILAATSAMAQEALRSSLAVDQVIDSHQNEPVNLAPDQPHLGPAQLSLRAYTGVDFEDNVNSSQNNPQSDAILHDGVNTGLLWPATPQSELDINTGIGFDHYVKHSEYDSLELAPNSELTWDMSFGDVSLTLYDQFSYSQAVTAQPAVTGVARFPTYDNTVGTRVSWEPGHWLFDAGYSHDLYFTDSAALQYLNRSSEYFFARAGWRFAEKTQAGLEASASLTSYQLAIQSDNSSISVGPYVEWQITDAIRATLRAGPTFYLFDSQGNAGQGAALNSYYAEFQLTHQLTDYISHQLSIQRNVSLALNQGGNYLEQFISSYSVGWGLTQRIGLGANATYEHGTQTFQNLVLLAPGFGFLLNQTEIYDYYSVGQTISWQATEKLSTQLGYSYYLRKSNLAERSYTQNRLTLSLNYTF